MQIFIILLLLTTFVSIYDHRHSKIPNWVTWPLLLAGAYAHAPGTLAIDASGLLLVLVWFFFNEKIGGGDVKIWLALLWALPLSLEDIGPIIMFAVLTVTSGLQVVIRRWHAETRPEENTAMPSAWRTMVFMALLTLFYWPWFHHV